MNKQAILDVLNSLEVVEQNGGDEAYILVDNNPENRAELIAVGVTVETFERYGEGNTFCILALAFGEGYANGFENGKLVYYAPGTINYLVQEAHGNAVDKGWWEKEPSFGEIIALIHSEASEALEDYRKGNHPGNVWYDRRLPEGGIQTVLEMAHDTDKPCGIPSELADIVIRVMDACGQYGINLEEAIREKMSYNATRPQRHGGKVI